MKIERPDLSAAKMLDANESGKRRSANRGFQKVLDESINRPTPTKTQRVGSQTPLIDPLAGITPTHKSNKNIGVQKIESFLDIIESYIQKLEDPHFTLRDLAPTIDKMAIKNEGVADFLDSLPDMDELKQIANEVLMISSVEIEKFNRGDYLDSYLERR